MLKVVLRKSILIVTIVVVLIVLAAVVTVVVSQRWGVPRYHLGIKEELVSSLSEYFNREPEIGVRITNETTFEDLGTVYRYDLISNIDSQPHGRMELLQYTGKVMSINLLWMQNGDERLRESGYLLLSGVADNTLTDWQDDDGAPNRNFEMLRLIEDNGGLYENWDLADRRVLNARIDEEISGVLVFIEP